MPKIKRSIGADSPSVRAVRRLHAFLIANAPINLVRGGLDSQRFDRSVEATSLGISDRICLEFHVSFGVGVSLMVSLFEEPEVNWSGSRHNLLEARAAIALYQTVVDFACQFEMRRREEMRYVEAAEAEAERAARKADPASVIVGACEK